MMFEVFKIEVERDEDEDGCYFGLRVVASTIDHEVGFAITRSIKGPRQIYMIQFTRPLAPEHFDEIELSAEENGLPPAEIQEICSLALRMTPEIGNSDFGLH
jgi:hypothetical protein